MFELIKLVKILFIIYNDIFFKYDVCVRIWNLILLYVNDYVRDKYYIVIFLLIVFVFINCIDYLCSVSMCIKVNVRSIFFDKFYLVGFIRGFDWLLY